MTPEIVAARIHASIQPQITRSYKLQWELLNPRFLPGRHTEQFVGSHQEAHTMTPIAGGGYIMHRPDPDQHLWRPAYHGRLQP